jgi:hypothetical protein
MDFRERCDFSTAGSVVRSPLVSKGDFVSAPPFPIEGSSLLHREMLARLALPDGRATDTY